MDMLHDGDIDLAPLSGKRVAILGYGNQGRAQALNLKDSGVNVVVGLRGASGSSTAAEEAGLEVGLLEDSVASADIVMFLAPDEVLGSIYREVEARIRYGAAIGFSHGLAIHFGFIRPRTDLDVFLVAPKGPGSALRSLFQQRRGMVGLWAIEHDASGHARELALAYGKAIGCARAGLIASTFAEECEADLFNEQAVVWGAVPEILIAGFDTLTEGGIAPEVAFLECVGELKLIAELIEQRGIAGMREAISNTAELGAVLGGPRIVDDSIRAKMREVLAEVRSGKFAQELKAEADAGYPLLEKARAEASGKAVEQAFRALKDAEPRP
jgi:ketol-acid reductoisomerase